LRYGAHHTPDLHTHDFSAMGLVTGGALTIVLDDRSTTYAVGDSYEVTKVTEHAEHTGTSRATALLGVRPT
jgi:quercetin dioxygenase-like cupin family protein